ncbi:MAG: hypothetical protein QME06_09255 [Desulfobacterales bacterium]|nr:hypothetical protein [Desulfobacterales bacterium]
MKKIVLIFILCMFLAGCGTLAKESEFYEHDIIYKNWDHMKFSIYGYKCPLAESLKNIDVEGWWGIEVPVNPDK